MGGGMNGEKAPERIEVPAEPKGETKVETRLKGIDTSHFTKGVKWKDVAADGNVFAIAKAFDGRGSVDSEYENSKKAAKDVGLLFGGYGFFRFDYSITEQAKGFMKVIGPAHGEIEPTVDIEWDKYSQHYGEGKAMDAEAASRAAQFIRILLSEGYKPQVYSNYYFFNAGKNAEDFAKCPLWISNYQAKTLAEVKIPKPWSKAHFWQYKGDKPGYGVDKMDFNYFLGGREELNKLVRR